MESNFKTKIMDVVKKLLVAGIILTVVACNTPTDSSGLTTVKVLEVEQVASYTYMLVKAKGPEYWIAVPTMPAKVGESYQYQGGMLMEDFHSKELDRTFDKVLFLEALFSPSGSIPGMGAAQQSMPSGHPAVGEATPGSAVKTGRAEVSVEAAEGITRIAELFASPGDFDGKTIRVKGVVAKYNPAIMERNWIHIQDGTEHDGKYDLTATSSQNFAEGEVVTLEGVLVVNKDFGYGYSYEILLEQAKAVE